MDDDGRHSFFFAKYGEMMQVILRSSYMVFFSRVLKYWKVIYYC